MDDLFFAKVCKVAYMKPHEVDEDQLEYKPTFIVMENTQCMIFEKDNKFVVSFAGTNDDKDVLDDLNIMRTSYYSISGEYCGRVHQGFINYYHNIRGKLLRYIMDYQKKDIPDKEIIFCGHSLGGSCCIAAIDIAHIEKKIPISVYTYGSPRIGNYTFAKKFNKKISKSVRVVNQYDPVTRIPLAIRYRHVDIEKKLDTKYSFKKFLNDMKLLFRGKVTALTGDHSLDEYIRKLSL